MTNMRSLAVLVLPTIVSCLDSATLDAIKAEIAAEIPANTQQTRQDRADVLGAMVRLPFHDAFGSGTKADGCLDPNEVDHNGLEQIRAVVDPICATHAAKLSRADCWAIVGNVAIAAAGGQEPAFRYGRTDCADESTVSDSVDGVSLLPSAKPSESNPWTHIHDVFVVRGGLTEKDIVALLGAHSLGRVSSDPASNSGFSTLPWIRNSHVLSNNYFIDIARIPWVKDTVNQEWIHTPPGGAPDAIMLETDMALVIDTSTCTAGGQNNAITFGGNGGGGNPSGCTLNDVPKAFVDLFADDNAAFLTHFQLAMQKLEEVGYTTFSTGVTTLCDVTSTSSEKACSTPSTPPTVTTTTTTTTTTMSFDCAQYVSTCKDVAGYVPYDDCDATVQANPGAAMACRIEHLERAGGDAAVHCPHAQPVATGPCAGETLAVVTGESTTTEGTATTTEGTAVTVTEANTTEVIASGAASGCIITSSLLMGLMSMV